MLHRIFYIFITNTIFISSLLFAQIKPSLNDPETAKKIIASMIERDDGTSNYSQVELLTCSYIRNNGTRKCRSAPIKKSIESLSLDIGNNFKDTISMGIINDPPSEKNMAFLQKDYDEEGKESDQWIYFPALKKLKRVVSQSENSPREGSVFGSEIAYEDIEKMHLSNYNYSYEGNEQVDKRSCDIIAAFPVEKYKHKTSYSKEVFWIDQQSKIPVKKELYDKRGKLSKTYYNKQISNIDGVWISKVRIVVNHDSHRMTMEKVIRTAVNPQLGKELLGLRALKDTSFRESKMKTIRTKAK